MVSKQQKIYDHFVSQIKDGVLRSGEALPSTRELAKLFKCHRFTAMTALQTLVVEGWVENSAKTRYRVSEKVPVTTSKTAQMNSQKSAQFKIARSKPETFTERERFRLEFWGGQPDLRLFPKDEFRRILSATLEKTKPDLLNYGHIDGLDIAKKEIAGYLRRTRNLLDKEFIITNGSQEALHLIAQVLIKPGDAIAVEAKGYPPAWRLFESLGAKIIPIEVDEEGLVTDQLEKQMTAKKIKMIYTTPLHQYPTTVSLSPRRRQALIQLCEKYQIPILEDDYDYEFHYSGPPPAPLSQETVYGIYICSFSKVLFPGARLGVIACDEQLKEHLIYQKYLVSRQTDCLSQLALAAWLKEGGFEKHLRRMRRTYEKRFLHLQDHLLTLQKKFDLSWHTPTGGMSIWANLNQDSKVIANRAKKQGVFFQNEQGMDYRKKTGTHLRIGFAGVNENEIDQGMAVLFECLG